MPGFGRPRLPLRDRSSCDWQTVAVEKRRAESRPRDRNTLLGNDFLLDYQLNVSGICTLLRGFLCDGVSITTGFLTLCNLPVRVPETYSS